MNFLQLGRDSKYFYERADREKKITMRLKGSEVLLQKFLFPVLKAANSSCDILLLVYITEILRTTTM